MAKLGKVKNSKPLSFGVDGVFIKNIPAKRMQQMFGNIEEKLANEPEGVVVELFNELICDEDGAAFEDVGTYDAITEVLSVTDIREIMEAIAETMNPNAKDLGK